MRIYCQCETLDGSLVFLRRRPGSENSFRGVPHFPHLLVKRHQRVGSWYLHHFATTTSFQHNLFQRSWVKSSLIVFFEPASSRTGLANFRMVLCVQIKAKTSFCEPALFLEKNPAVLKFLAYWFVPTLCPTGGRSLSLAWSSAKTPPSVATIFLQFCSCYLTSSEYASDLRSTTSSSHWRPLVTSRKLY